MADIEQSLQEIQQERSRLLTAKENLKTAIVGKGVTVPDSAKLDEYSSFVNGIQQGESIDLSFVTAGAGDILSGKVGTDKDGNPVNGTIATVTPSLSGNKFTIGKGYVSENKELTVPEAQSPTVSGNTVTIHPGYVPTEQTIETEGGSMEIYKCVDADGMTWWVVSGCGSTEANGRYYQGEDVKSDYGESYKIYYQKDGSCSLEYEYYDGRWVLKSGGTTLYRNDNWDYYNGDPSQCVNWITDSGVEPVPTITKETTTGNGWRGKKYDMETDNISDTITNLTYTAQMPKIGKLYTSDGTFEISKKSGLLLYAPCAEYGKEIEYYAGAGMPAITYYYVSQDNFTTIKGVKCFQNPSPNKMAVNINFGELQGFTASCMFYTYNTSQPNYQAPVCFGSALSNTAGKDVTLLAAHLQGKIYIGDYVPEENLLIEHQTEKWSHIGITFDNAGNYVLYYNGVPYYSDVADYKTKMFNYMTLCDFINNWNNGGTFFKGAVAEVKLWGKALTAAEIKAEADRCLAMVTE